MLIIRMSRKGSNRRSEARNIIRRRRRCEKVQSKMIVPTATNDNELKNDNNQPPQQTAA